MSQAAAHKIKYVAWRIAINSTVGDRRIEKRTVLLGVAQVLLDSFTNL